ncbi:MAG: mechanosensitive ion channel [Oscillatoria princeps RMCB-10]|jgi:small conductance mechanosensitive channel|nr:mechanosensitive ion channel [Oscillatoria princeps RMCB-10]
MKLILYRLKAVAATSLLCVFVSWSVPVSAKEAGAEETPISATISGEAVPDKATTISDPTIPMEDLKQLLKPLTLEELQHEAAGWLLLLKNKVQKISDTEIAIKRQRRALEAKDEASKLVGEAKTKLAEAETALAAAPKNTPEYQAATKQFEEARDALKTAQTALKKAADVAAELEGDTSVRAALGEAEQEKEIAAAEETFKKAKKARQEIPADSLRYKEVTPKIDALEAAIKELEKAEENLKATVPKSPEYQKAKYQLDQVREAVKTAARELTDTMSGGGDSSALPGAESDVGAGADSAYDKVDVENLEPKGGQASGQQKLEKVTTEIEKAAEKDKGLKTQLTVNVTNLQAEQTAITDRLKTVLDEVDIKGGDTTGYRKYIQAISAVEVDLKDKEGMGVRLLSWLQSDEGGMRWGTNLGKFATVLIVTIIVAQLLGALLNAILPRFSGVSSLFREFIVVTVKRGGIVIGVLLALTALEVSVAPILAVVGGVSFVLAFALQSNLGNFASGLMLMVNKPFDVGDEVKVSGLWGYIKAINLASTTIEGWGGQIYTVPNNTVWGSIIENLTSNEIRGGSIMIKIPFGSDVQRAREILADVCKSNPGVVKSGTFVWSYEDYYTSIFWSFKTKNDDFWTVWDELHSVAQDRLAQAGIKLAIPTQDLRIQNSGNGANGAQSVMPSVRTKESSEMMVNAPGDADFDPDL